MNIIVKVAIVGGTGYGAVELIRLLNNHPHVTVEKILSHSSSGTKLSEVYPHLSDIIDLEMDALDVEALSKQVDLVFFATPSNISKDYIPKFFELGIRCIDLSGDFRLEDEAEYRLYYEDSLADEKYIKEAVYGLPEINKEKIKDTKILANPGCYPTATLLGLLPAFKHDLVEQDNIIIDAKTGVSGAGRGLSLNVHFSEMNENFKAYKLGSHKHIPEIEQELTTAAGETIQVTFTPHIVPMTRGIMSTIYVNLKEHHSSEEIISLYQKYYKDHPFVRVRNEGIIPSTREVYGSNYCDIGIFSDERTGKLTIVSVIDNLVKGASGQAIQNMNLMCGWDETTGITQLPIYP
ncbi:N-acetyl-gamma-glutamyl-phosphate reductase [Saliterribacillus persicus]|uniref:N-acetyl-gamma-glutamyl-phosphate reductase n=1 Tax=Saliterribacillus persicus TaxID=930114 RepID=UPI000DF319C2|nr:N-acetyl-gamma-glutamyl-phosphate reductase [Saliterribacillus persicus]